MSQGQQGLSLGSHGSLVVFHDCHSGISSFYKSFGTGDQIPGPAHAKHVFSHLGSQQGSVSFVMTSDLNRMI